MSSLLLSYLLFCLQWALTGRLGKEAMFTKDSLLYTNFFKMTTDNPALYVTLNMVRTTFSLAFYTCLYLMSQRSMILLWKGSPDSAG